MGVVYFSIIPTFEPSRYYKCWIVCFFYKFYLDQTGKSFQISYNMDIRTKQKENFRNGGDNQRKRRKNYEGEHGTI